MTHTSLQAVLNKYGIIPRKALGQHFLSAMPTIRKIVEAIGPSKDECVLEIGPGPALMTRLIAQRAGRVIAVEKDGRLAGIAREELSEHPNVEIVEGDFLTVDFDELLSRVPEPLRGKRIKVAGNLPYNVSSPILFRLLDRAELISRAVVMLQKEVAMRIVAQPGKKDYGILSVRFQAMAKARRLFDVAPGNFIPPPEVMSSIVEIDFESPPAERPEDEDWFADVVKAAFGKRRKTLRNALIGSGLPSLSAGRIDEALSAISMDGRRRPETLSTTEFIALARAMKR